MDISQNVWQENDAANNTAAPDGAPEGMAPSGVNDVIRADRGAIKRWYNQSIPLLTGGSSTAYTLSYGVTPTALADGMTHLVEFNADCGASPTLNVGALGAKPIHYWTGTAWAVVPAATIKIGMVVRVAYNLAAGTYRIVTAPVPVMAQSIGATDGYTSLPGGTTPIRMQWGQVTLGGSGTNVNVTFPVAFSAAPYTVQLTGTTSMDRALYFNFFNATGVTIVNPSTGITTTAFWLAIGPA
jgi:hypothetical protein